MKKVLTYQKYKCDFCNKRSVKHVIERHERICYLNPKRECRYMGRMGYQFTKNHDDPNCEDCRIAKEALKLKNG